ncbi:MAG TPA: GatB/YqeY domain-containing protein [Solirubrobacterales bacterium]|nr:GatB/YqeY domain-containing protein [Solirubrobacterales bacterium]
MSDEILERVQADTRTAMKAGERDRVGTLRMLASSLQQDEKEGEGDAVAVLQRERKKRIEAAEAFETGGRSEQAAAERDEATLIESYLPEQISDEELERIVVAAVESTGATDVKEMGKVIGVVMPQVKGRADGKRVSTMVRERLGA